jgi:hypothetical protein
MKEQIITGYVPANKDIKDCITFVDGEPCLYFRLHKEDMDGKKRENLEKVKIIMEVE